MAGLGLGNVSTIATSLTYLYVAVQGIAGRLTRGDLTLYTAAAQSVQGSIQGLLGGFASMYEHNLYLNNLYELMATKTSLPVAAAPVAEPERMRGESKIANVTVALPGAAKNAIPVISSLAQL